MSVEEFKLKNAAIGDLKNVIPYLSSPIFLETQRLLSNPVFLELHKNSIKLPEAPAIQSAYLPPKALAEISTDISVLKGINIAHINSFLGQFDQIPSENFGVIKQAVSQNRSKIRNAAKANHEAASDMVKQASENDTDETLSISETIAQLITDIDDSIELPKPDSKQIIHIDKSNIKSYMNVVSLLISILSLIFAIYQGQSGTKLSEQQHAESTQGQHKQISLQERQIKIDEQQIRLQKQQIEIDEQQAEYLRQVTGNAASNNSADQSSEKTPKNIAR